MKASAKEADASEDRRCLSCDIYRLYLLWIATNS